MAHLREDGCREGHGRASRQVSGELGGAAHSASGLSPPLLKFATLTTRRAIAGPLTAMGVWTT